MALAVSTVVDEIKNLLNRGGLDVLTLTWPEFYKIADRERIKVEFTTELSAAMKASSLLIVYGNAVVLVAKDYRFAPLKTK